MQRKHAIRKQLIERGVSNAIPSDANAMDAYLEEFRTGFFSPLVPVK
jgi:hypothetical protein